MHMGVLFTFTFISDKYYTHGCITCILLIFNINILLYRYTVIIIETLLYMNVNFICACCKVITFCQMK